MRLLREQYAPGAISGEEPIVHSEGEEGGLVTRGTVELTVDVAAREKLGALREVNGG